MPISDIDGCPASHWAEVLAIIQESLADSRFKAEIVSSSSDTAIIHHTIVSNLYKNPIIVCDVSARNPNVMLELGMRLAFDKPVVIIKDDETPYSFDTSPIQHLPYPRDLRFTKIQQFKKELLKKVEATYAQFEKNGSFFLKDYPSYKASVIPEESVSLETVMGELRDVKSALSRFLSSSKQAPLNGFSAKRPVAGIVNVSVNKAAADKIVECLNNGGRNASVITDTGGEVILNVLGLPGENSRQVYNYVRALEEEIGFPI